MAAWKVSPRALKPSMRVSSTQTVRVPAASAGGAASVVSEAAGVVSVAAGVVSVP